MKLCPLKASENTLKNIRKLARQLKEEGGSFEVFSPVPKISPQFLILIGNGTPDDLILAILAHKFNGSTFVFLVRPEVRRNIPAIRTIPTLIKQAGVKIRKILFLVDQETQLNLEKIFIKVESLLQKEKVKILQEERSGRLEVLTCSFQGKEFDLILVINGLDRPYQKHSIEDHLLEALRLTSILPQNKLEKLVQEAGNDPKRAWWEKVEKKTQLQILAALHQMNKERLREIFPQQYQAFQLFLSSKNQV